MKKMFLLIGIIATLNLFCATFHSGCKMQNLDDQANVKTIKAGNYEILWNIPGHMTHVNSDFTLQLAIKDSLGNRVADSGQGRWYVQKNLYGTSEDMSGGPLWLSNWNETTHCYEVSGIFPYAGRYRLDLEFLSKDTIDIKCQIPVLVIAEIKAMQMDHDGGGMMGGHSGCH